MCVRRLLMRRDILSTAAVAEQLCGLSSRSAVMQPPLPVERLAHDLIQSVVLRFPSELGANPILAATIAAGAAARPAHGKTDACTATLMRCVAFGVDCPMRP